MAYSDFTLPMVLSNFKLTPQNEDMFASVAEVQPSALLANTLEQNRKLVSLINSEKAWSELMIAPMLMEVWKLAQSQPATLYSGLPFDVDPAAKLNGYCDFILGHGVQLPYVTAPLVIIVEAKKEDVNGGLGQCAAAMVAAMQFNAAAQNRTPVMYGCVTSGLAWRFLKLEANVLTVDASVYQSIQVPKLLGIFLHLLGVTPEEVNRARP